MSTKMIQSLDSLHKNRAKFAECLHEEDLKICKVSCCFTRFMFNFRIKQGLYAVNHIKTTKIGSFMVNWCLICHEDPQQILPCFQVKSHGYMSEHKKLDDLNKKWECVLYLLSIKCSFSVLAFLQCISCLLNSLPW